MGPLALLVIMVLSGSVILMKSETAFSKKRVLVKPQSSYIGVALIIIGISNLFIPFNGITIALFLIIFIVAFAMSKKIETNESAENISNK